MAEIYDALLERARVRFSGRTDKEILDQASYSAGFDDPALAGPPDLLRGLDRMLTNPNPASVNWRAR